MPLPNDVIHLLDDMILRGESIDTIAGALQISKTCVRNRIEGKKTTTIENKEQSYRDNLKWAIDAAGHTLRTKKKPKSCPNNSAWFLYKQALEEPKDFLTKVGQVESKLDDSERDREFIRSTKYSIEEINSFLERMNDGKKEKESA